MGYYTVHSTGTVYFNLTCEINNRYAAVTVPQLSYNATSTFNHQILLNMAMNFDLC